MSFAADLRYALRMMRRRPGFSAIAVFIVALGVGANTAVFSLVDAVLLNPLPFSDPERLVLVSSFDEAKGAVGVSSYADFRDFSQASETLDALAAFSEDSFIVSGDDGAERVRGEIVTPAYFGLLGVQPIAGRAFSEDERDPVALLSEAFVERRFGPSADVVGRNIRLNDRAFVVIGVMPRSFDGFAVLSRLWVPMSQFDELNPELVRYDILGSRGTRWLSVVGRLASGFDLDEARAELAAAAASLARTHPDTNEGRGVHLRYARDEVVSDHRASLLLLSAAVGFLLLLACVNLANLFLVRVLSRRSEVSMRIALGASRGRLVRQFLAEAALLASCGGVGGVVIALGSIRLFAAFQPVTLPNGSGIALDGRVFAFALLLSAVTALACGLFPALSVSRGGLSSASQRGARSGHGGRRTLSGFALAEIAMATLLLIGAGLVLKSFDKMRAFEPGFVADHLLTMKFHVPAGVATEAFFERMTEEVAAVPGIASAAITSHVYFGDGYMSGNVTVESFAPVSRADEVKAYHHFVSDDYLQAMGIPLVSGDGLSSAENTVLVNRSFAERMWPGERAGDLEAALGKRLVRGTKHDDKAWLTVVGVVGDVKPQLRPRDADRLPQFYFRLNDGGEWSRALVVRTSVDPGIVAEEVRAALRRLHPGTAVFAISTMEELIARERASMRALAYLMVGFASLALALAALGLYAVIAYAVGESTHEIGVRLAVGATAHNIMRLVMTRAVAILSCGLSAGLLVSLVAGGFARSLLYEVEPIDVSIFCAVAAGMTAVVLIASYIPARRAANVDVVEALRSES